ncbi:gluconokinase [Salibacterium halotolerans]|uniref:Gluconokinase n=1 Tax=Salibacterium halotolerans TaxID=1884432 RepID=A0A1I5TN32_9BACI|nr:gluconokinase [Salibacterium halotolerans]SFP84445.1 gluconokinase [Salibacterium halotolerans]
MSRQVVIGLDIGTTSTKCLAYDVDGEIWAEKEVEYTLHSPDPSRKEQDPEEILKAVKVTLSHIVYAVQKKGAVVAGAGFSAAMHSLLALDHSGNVLTNAVTWADQRSVKEAEELKANGGHELYLRTGTPVHPMSPLTKLMWFQRNQPDIFVRAAKWISIKEYIVYQLFGRFLVDHSIASATGLFQLKTKQWDDEALRTAGITADQLSELVPATYILKGMTREAAAELDIDPDTPFVMGASDGVLANIGAGAVSPGQAACSIGTSGAVRTVVDKPTLDPKGRIFCYELTEDKWVIGGPINNGGIALQWIKDQLYPDLDGASASQDESTFDEMTKRASAIQPGAAGLVFLPYLMGERAPFWDSDTKGVFFGLTLNHGRDHMVRSVLEGVMYQMYSVVIALTESGVQPQEYRCGGGFARSELWRQMMADIFEEDIVIPESHQGSCFGAAWLTMYALDMVPDLSSVRDLIKTTIRHQPVEKNVTAYRDIKPIFLRLARGLHDEFKAISEVQRRHATGGRTLSSSD